MISLIVIILSYSLQKGQDKWQEGWTLKEVVRIEYAQVSNHPVILSNNAGLI